MSDLFTIEPEVFGVIPGLRVVVVVVDELSAGDAAAIDSRWQRAWSAIHGGFGYPNPQSHPHIQAWRLAMKSAGASHKDYPTSVEALVRRALKSPEPFCINPLVDFYNSVSLDHVVPAGGFDLDSIPEPLQLRLTRDGDTFESLDASVSESVPAGELAYTSGSSVVTRHLVWRQSRLGLVTATTRRSLFVSEVLPDHHGVAEAVQQTLVSGFSELFGASVHARVLSEDRPTYPKAGI